MPAQRLEIIVAGNFDSAKKAFGQLSSQVDGFQGKFNRSSRQFETASRKYSKGIFKNLIREVGEAGTSFLPAAGNIGIFAGALSSIPFLGAAAGAAGLGIALLTMAKRTDPAVEAAKRLAAAQGDVKEAVAASKDALDSTAKAQAATSKVEQDRATVLQSLADNRRRLAAWEKKYGEDSDQYRTALVGVRDAELKAREAAVAREQTYAAAISSQVKSARAIDTEIASLQKKKEILTTLLLPVNQQALGAEQTAKNQRELARVTDILNVRLSTAEARHRANATAASTMAASIDGADEKSRNLRASLERLSKQELNAAAIAGFLNRIGGAAQNAFNAVTNLWGAVSNPPNPGGGGGGGKRPGGKPAPKPKGKVLTEIIRSGNAFTTSFGTDTRLSLAELAGDPAGITAALIARQSELSGNLTAAQQSFLNPSDINEKMKKSKDREGALLVEWRKATGDRKQKLAQAIAGEREAQSNLRAELEQREQNIQNIASELQSVNDRLKPAAVDGFTSTDPGISAFDTMTSTPPVTLYVNVTDSTLAGMSPEQRRKVVEQLAPEFRRALAVA